MEMARPMPRDAPDTTAEHPLRVATVEERLMVLGKQDVTELGAGGKERVCKVDTRDRQDVGHDREPPPTFCYYYDS